MAQAKYGDTVVVHYEGKLTDGTVFDTSTNSDPLQFTIGDGEIIPGFEEAVVGMSVGETRTAEIPSEQAYGPHQPELVVQVTNSARSRTIYSCNCHRSLKRKCDTRRQSSVSWKRLSF
jgi:FKBP-type peptidyl-prolyl cis-trans isomerase 2